MSWSKFEASASEDETLGSAFSTTGLFRISNEEKSVKNPSVFAALQNESIVLAVDKSLVLLEEKSSNDCKFLSFDAAIDCFSVSKSGNLVICCLSDGNIHGVHVKGVPLFNLNIPSVDVNLKRSFLEIIQGDDGFTIMTSNGKIFKLANVDEQIFNASMTESFKLEDAEALQCVSFVKLASHINTFCSAQTYEGEMFIACGSEYVFFITSDGVERIKYPKHISEITKIFNLEHYFIGLTKSGDFVDVCPHTKSISICVHNPEGSLPVADFKVLEINSEFIDILVLTAADNSKERLMRVVEFPLLKCKTELQLPGISWLVSQQKSEVNMYFIEGLENEERFVQSIEIKSIVETDPEQRYKKLLQRGLFDEAEELAKQFELSLEPLHEAKIKRSILALEELKPGSKAFDEKFKVLMSQVAQIENKNFLVKLRLLQIPDRNCMTTFLTFMLENIDTNHYQQETNDINELLLRLETLRMIDPDECNLGWQKFLYNKNMLRVAMDFFKTDVVTSCLVWSRHSSSIFPSMDLTQFHKWLSNIPSTVQPFDLIQWLKHFAPCFFQLYPQEMTHLVDWCLERTRALHYSKSWPEVGLEFINSINDIFKEVKFLFVDIRRPYHYNMEKIQHLIFTLEELTVLKTSYLLSIPLDDYSKSSIEETAFKLLQRIKIQNFKRLVNDFLCPIFAEHGGSPEEVIVDYIKFLCNSKNLGFWQERAVTAIDMLTKEENRLTMALAVLKVSPVPWAEIVLPLAMLGTTSSHPLANAIYIEYKTQAIKIIKVKYDWPVDYFDLDDDRIKLVRRVLKLNKPEMIEDVKTLIKASPDIACEAYTYLLRRLIGLGRIDEFTELVSAIPLDFEHSRRLFQMSITMFVIEIDDNEFRDPVEGENVMEAAKILIKHLTATYDDYLPRKDEEKLKNLKTIAKLRNQFKLEVKLKEFDSTASKKKLLEAGIAFVAEEITEKTSLDPMWSKMELLVHAFGFGRIFCYKMLCEKLNNLFVTCNIIDMLCSTIDMVDKTEIGTAKSLAILAVAQQISFLENNLKSSFDIYDPLAFPLAYELLIRCMGYYDIQHHTQTLDLLKWFRVGRSCYPLGVIKATKGKRVIDSSVFTARLPTGASKNRRETFSMFEDFAEDKVVVQKEVNTDENLFPVLRCLCNSLKVVIFAMPTSFEPFKSFQPHLSRPDDAANIKTEFFGTLESLIKLKLYKASIRLMQLVTEQQNKAHTVIIPQPFASNIHKKVLKYMLSQKNPEYMAAFRILKSEANRDECINFLRANLKNNSQKIAFSTFSEMYNQYIGNDNSVANERQNRLKFYYYSELCKYDQSLRFKPNFDEFSVGDLLKDISDRPLSVELVKKLSKDFNWDYQKKLIQQVKTMLRSQEIDFEIKMDVFGKEEVIVKTTVEMIRNKIAPYKSEITNLTLLAAEMHNFMKEINYYFYEMYLVVLELVEHCCGLTSSEILFRNVLLLLKHNLTGKRCRAEQPEIDAWQKLQHENTMMPAISKYRFPFKPLMEGELESFLNSDLNVDTFEKFMPLISLHASHAELNADDCLEKCGMFAVKNSVMEQNRSNTEAKTGTEWNLKPTNNAFLLTILRMVSLLRDKTKQLAILYFHMTHSPEGSDQVEASYECWKFVVANEEEIMKSPKFRDFAEKVKRKYLLFKTQHLLHLYGLTDDKLMQLVENPIELINALYHHESILKPQKKDVNNLCEELSELHGLDLLSLQHKLLHNWLAFAGNTSCEEADANETVYEDFISSQPVDSENIDDSDINVARAHYILSNWNNDQAMEYLSGELGTCSSNTDNQLQLYECFAKLNNNKSASYVDLINPEDYFLIKSCHYLKQLGLHYRPEAFKSVDKVELLKKVWSSYYNNSKGLEVMSFICLSYQINLPQIWNGILKQMVAQKMISHLSSLVEILSTRSKLLHLSNLKVAWECVIKEPFLHATKTRSDEQDLKLIKALVLLQKCPISTFLDLQSFVEQCLRLERPHMAAIFLAFVNEKNREPFMAMFQPFDKAELKKNVVELEDFGIAPVVTKSVVNILKL